MICLCTSRTASVVEGMVNVSDLARVARPLAEPLRVEADSDDDEVDGAAAGGVGEVEAAAADGRERRLWRFDPATPMAIPAISHPLADAASHPGGPEHTRTQWAEKFANASV